MICLVGDILTDINLSAEPEPKMRLGGIIHAARAFWAMDIEYSVAYFAPSYMEEHINNCLSKYNCKEGIRLGEVLNNPYIILIKEAQEVGDQGYEFLYKDTVDIRYFDDGLRKIANFEHLLIISGSYRLEEIFRFTNTTQNIYLDCANNIQDPAELNISSQVNTIFVSTSSPLFEKGFSNFPQFCDLFKGKTINLIVKENRGGSIWFNYENGNTRGIPCYISEVDHSVGVGDVFDAVVVAQANEGFENSLYRASWIAKDYGETTFVNNLKINIQRSLKVSIQDIKNFDGCFLPWEERQKCHIYLAAPDFAYVDSMIFDKLEECLAYHNFVLHRPVKENGQLPENPSKAKRRELFNLDMALLNECKMVIAVLPYNDPGTLIEIGIASQLKIHTLLYDPKDQAYNCMLTEIPDKICRNLNELICEVFKGFSKMYKNGLIQHI